MARWFSSDCSPCKPHLKSIQVTVPWLGIYANVGAPNQTNGKWNLPANCYGTRCASWVMNFGVCDVTIGLPGKPFDVTVAVIEGSVNAYVAGVEPSYTETVTKTRYWYDSTAGGLKSALLSVTAQTGFLYSWTIPYFGAYAGLTSFPISPAQSLVPESTFVFKLLDQGSVTPGTLDFPVTRSLVFSNQLPSPIAQALDQASLDELKALDFGQHSVNGVVTTFSDPSTIPSYIFNQAINAASNATQSPGRSGSQNIFWTARRVAVLFPWPDMDGCVVTAKTINNLTGAEGSLNCVVPLAQGASDCEKCYGGCSQITSESLDDAIDPNDDPIIYLEPPEFGQQYLVVKTASCPDALINRTASVPCGCCPIDRCP